MKKFKKPKYPELSKAERKRIRKIVKEIMKKIK